MTVGRYELRRNEVHCSIRRRWLHVHYSRGATWSTLCLPGRFQLAWPRRTE